MSSRIFSYQAFEIYDYIYVVSYSFTMEFSTKASCSNDGVYSKLGVAQCVVASLFLQFRCCIALVVAFAFIRIASCMYIVSRMLSTDPAGEALRLYLL